MVYKTTRVYLFAMVFFAGCSMGSHGKSEKPDEQLPFDYNMPAVHVFAVKTTTKNGNTLFSDTLGLMCTNKAEREKATLKSSSWLFLCRSADGKYTLNSQKVNNRSDGTLSSRDTLLIHPPRVDQYTILQICPYPFLQFPLYIGRKWDWDLNVGSRWSPGKLLSWSGDELFSSRYEVTDSNAIIIPSLGKIPCFHIHAINTSKFGTSSADLYYSYTYGIVKLSYLPLDSTKVEFNLLTTTRGQELFKAMFSDYHEESEFMDLFKK